MNIEFQVLMKPAGKERPRSGNGHMYTPTRTKEAEERIAWAYRRAARGFRFPPGTPLVVDIDAYYAIPKSASRAKREKMTARQIAPTVKPDRDNVEKLVCDALNGVAYDDDKCVVDGRTRKLYADTPRIEIRIKEWTHQKEESK